MNYKKYLKSKSRGIVEAAKKGDIVSFYNDAGEKVMGRVMSVNGNIYTIDYEGNTYQTNSVNEDVVYKKGDVVSFHNDLKKMVQGRIVSISGDKYVIDVHGIKFKRNYKDLFVNDRLGEDAYGFVSGYGVGDGVGVGLFGRTGSAMSLTDPPSAEDDTGDSLRGELSDVRKKVASVISRIKSGDISGAAKLAVRGVFRYGNEYKEILDKEVGSNKEFESEYAKEHASYASGKSDKDKK